MTQQNATASKQIESVGPRMRGFVRIVDKITREVILDIENAINFETMSEALAQALADQSDGHIYQMAFGNGGTTVSGTGAVTYFPPNVTGSDAALYNQTYQKVVDNLSPNDVDPTLNFITVTHSNGRTFSDLVVTCTLGYSEPAGQEAFDTTTNMESQFIFDELGLVSFGGRLLTHVIFSPVQKAVNRIIEIQYTLRISLD